MLTRCGLRLSRATFILAAFASTLLYGAQTVPAPGPLAALADEFYVTRAQFDPLNYATANGDSRYDDQLGMSIAPGVRAAYFAHSTALQKQLAAAAGGSLSASEQLSRRSAEFLLDSAVRPRALSGAPAADQPDGQRAECARQLRQRHRLAAADDAGAVPRLPEPPAAPAGLDRPGHPQHARRHAQRRRAAEGDHRSP